MVDELSEDDLLHHIQDRTFWRDFAPALSISDAPAAVPPAPRAPMADKRRRIRLVNEGYLHVTDLNAEAPFAEMAQAMERLRDMGLPPAFIAVFDEPWALCARMRSLMDNLFDSEAALVPDFWGWVIRPGEAGFTPHRDRPEGAIQADGQPITLTVWMPLTEARPDNGCICVYPANVDTGYLNPHVTPTVSYQDIRAVPAQAGDLVIWTGRVVHWGGSSSTYATGNRISIAWEFQDKASPPVEGHLMEKYPDIPFETRLGLIARQIGFYKQRSGNIALWNRIEQHLAEKYPIKDLATG